MTKSVVLALLFAVVVVRGQHNRPRVYEEAGEEIQGPVDDWQTAAASGGRSEYRDECRSCNPDDCTKPYGCLAGVVKDGCGCCDVCGKVEYELCHHPGVSRPRSYYGRCGENLECRLRTDLDEGEGPEAICYCRIEGALCGSDNETYDNICQLMASAVAKGARMTINHKGPCNVAPTIISAPENVKNTTGSNIAIMCEAKGYPIPTIEWTWTRVDGQTIYLPSDDLHISVNMRGGPDKWQITGWLQIIDLKKTHEGDYTCIAQNDISVVKASARLNVIG